ncbi:hypothetical protein [Streptomyces sp. NPDC002402]
MLVIATDAGREAEAEAEVYVPVGAAGAEALSRYDQEQLATILGFLQTARQVQEGQAGPARHGRRLSQPPVAYCRPGEPRAAAGGG